MVDLTNKKILLVRNDNVGDLICTTPAIEALRRAYPNNQIDIVVNSYNYDAINKNPFVNKIYCYTKPKHKSGLLDKIKAGLGKLQILWQIKKENYYVVVIFRSGYSKSAELFSNITKAQYKVGVKNPKGRDNFNLHVEVKNNEHEVEFCLNCLKEFGVKYNNENTFYYIDKNLTDKYKDYSDYILFHISSRIKENQYEKENFKKVIDNLNTNKILISAEPIDFESAQWLDENTEAKFINTSSLNDLGGLIKNIKIFITLDGGAMHLGPAVGTKTISISGKTNMAKWHPWGYKELVIQNYTKKADDIDVNIIFQKIKENL
ncbi:MAG TPA: lipopolysaccharide heptosyltransferase family protein [Arcobacter sp.]|nr:lipopolysaccharide heptosyltransferase family protein [Arcobacter sp.]